MARQANKSEDVIELDKYNKDKNTYEQLTRRGVNSQFYEDLQTKTNENGDSLKNKVPRTKVVIIVLSVLVTILVATVIAVIVVVAIVIKESGNFGTNSNSVQQNSASNQSTEDLLTAIAEEKRLRHQLENRLNGLEQSQHEVIKELRKESGTRQELEAKYSAMKDELENMTTLVQGAFVGFSVSMRSFSPVSVSNTLQMFYLDFNDSNDFNISAGVFVCKKPGIYFFTLSFVTYGKGNSWFCIIYKNEHQSPVNAKAGVNSSTGTTSGLLNLKEGDRINVGKCSLPQDYYSIITLTGYLLQPIRK